MLHDIGIVELHTDTADLCGEIGLVDLRSLPFRELDALSPFRTHRDDAPLSETREYFVNIIFRPVNLRRRKFSAAAGNLPFRGVAAVYHSDVFVIFHISHSK